MRRGTGEKLNISIVVPVYNVSLYIERCIRSVMVQTYPVMECIIVDDATEDDSIEKCERLIKEYNDNVNLLETAVAEQATIGRADHNLDHNLDILCKQSEQARAKGRIRFKILHHEVNRGLSAARNTGTDAAQGDYIYYLDSDDELTADCIEKLARPIERDPNIEMVQGNHLVISENTSKIGNTRVFREEFFFSSSKVRGSYFDLSILRVVAWNKLISKKFLTDYGLHFMEGVLFEDAPWIFYILKHLQLLYLIPDITYKYYVRPLSITTGTDKKKKAYHYSIIYEEIARHFTPGEEPREAKYYMDSFFGLFITNREIEGYKRALPLFEKALAGSDNRRERLLLWILRLSSKPVFWNKIFTVLLKVRRVLLYPLRRLKSYRVKKKN